MWNLKRNDTNELIYETETDSQTKTMNFGYQWGRMEGRDSQGVWDPHLHTAVFKMDNQQGPTVQHREVCSVLCGSLDGRGVWGEWIHVYVWLSPFADLKLLHIVNGLCTKS